VDALRRLKTIETGEPAPSAVGRERPTGLGLLSFFAYYKPVESQFSNVNVGLLSSYITYRCKNPGLTLKCISTAASHPNAIESISVKVYKTDRPVKPE